MEITFVISVLLHIKAAWPAFRSSSLPQDRCVLRGPEFYFFTSANWPVGQSPTSWDLNKCLNLFATICFVIYSSPITAAVLNNLLLCFSNSELFVCELTPLIISKVTRVFVLPNPPPLLFQSYKRQVKIGEIEIDLCFFFWKF